MNANASPYFTQYVNERHLAGFIIIWTNERMNERTNDGRILFCDPSSQWMPDGYYVDRVRV